VFPCHGLFAVGKHYKRGTELNYYSEKLKGRDEHLEYLDVGEGILLSCILNK
jgi:hypothetical protein